MLPDALADELWNRGVRARPGVVVSRAEFVSHVVATNREAPPQGWDSLHAEDLYLACACARLEPAALECFERTLIPAVRGTLLRVAGSAAAADEATQRLRERVLMRKPSRLCEFGGRSALITWLRAVATRVALDAREPAQQAASDEGVLESVLDSGDDPELAALKAPIRHAFQAAFREALAALNERERAVLRTHYVDGLTTEQLGRLYDVHKITVTRWLVGARRSLLSGMRERLRSQLSVGSAELDSLLRVARSSLGRSLSGLSPTASR